MQKRNSKTIMTGKIMMMQNNLMSKLATIDDEQKKPTDDLGFGLRGSQFDSLTNLLSKAKQVTNKNQEKIQLAKTSLTQNNKQKFFKKKSDACMFLTGIGLSIQPIENSQKQNQQNRTIHREYYTNPINYQQEDPDKIIMDMVKKNQEDDLAELRKMIKKTNSSLQDYGKKLLKTRKEVLGMADRCPNIDYKLFNKVSRYEDNQY